MFCIKHTMRTDRIRLEGEYMAVTTLTRLKYLHYLRAIRKATQSPISSEKFKKQACDILYTFLNYYRHVGETPTLIHRGTFDVFIIQQFQGVYSKYHLDTPVVDFDNQTLLKALSATMKVMTLWFEAINHQLKVHRIDFRPLKNQKDIIKNVHMMEHKIKKRQEKCLQIYMNKNSATFITMMNTSKKG